MATNDFAGVFGVPDPSSALDALGVATAWHDADVAFGGAPIGADTTRTVVASGEAVLDNLDALRQRLERPQATALELIAELYRCHGPQAGAHVLGMIAVAIWDTRARRLVLLRDGVGARTLYYARQKHAWWFAARLRTLHRCPGVSRDLSLPALRDYLTYAFVPGAQTLYRDIEELRPGTTLTLPGNATHVYWEPAERLGDRAEPLENHARRLRVLLEDAVRVRLPAGGPVGVYLSGGLDSSLVTALAAQFATGPVHTFALHFGHEYPNELLFSRLVAEHCRTQHHVLEFPGRLVRDTFGETIAALDDPIGDPLTVPNLLLGRAAARETGVILNGEGGDPCFGGPKNVPMLLHELYASAPEQSREKAYLRSYQKCYDDLDQLLSPSVRAALQPAPPPESMLTPFFGKNAMSSYLNQLAHINTRLKGADHILTKVNNLTAANGLLGRSPLFDRRVVDDSFATPPEHKLAGAVEKAVLKRAVADLLPQAILDRPKSGMLVPVQAWFRRDMKRWARGLLLGRRARIRPYINRELVREWLDYEGNLWPRHGVKLWLLATLEVWLQVNDAG